MSDVLKIDPDGPVDWVTLTRPGWLNALNDRMVSALVSHFEGL